MLAGEVASTMGTSGRGELAEQLEAGGAWVAGVLSGTSADGIDVALFRPRFERRSGGLWPVELGLAAFETRAFPGELEVRLRVLLDEPAGPLGPRVALAELARLDVELGRAFGVAARAVARGHARELALVGSHGQTLWHHDGRAPLASLQLGDGDFVAEAAGCSVVSDFRARDLAVGGSGAPIGALVDPWLFSAAGETDFAILNLGGLGNLSLFAAGELCHSFDTGPAGALLDHLARKLMGQPFDRGGRLALTGSSDAALEGRWFEAVVNGTSLAHFAAKPPPKSSGREAFGAAFADALLELAGERPAAELMATGVELVAHAVAAGLALAPDVRPAHLEVAGGGVHNEALLRALARQTGLDVRSTAASGVDPDAREALIFGLFAAAHVLGEPLPPGSSGRGPTGAAHALVCGKFSLAPLR
jgi:anhydro-N-acetylmuramic acid kinase